MQSTGEQEAWHEATLKAGSRKRNSGQRTGWSKWIESSERAREEKRAEEEGEKKKTGKWKATTQKVSKLEKEEEKMKE